MLLFYRNQIVNKENGTPSPDTRCSTNGCWYCSSLCKCCMKVTNSELCDPCHMMYFDPLTSSMQQPKFKHLNLEVSETTVAKLHAFYVDELEVEGGKKERVVISIYLCAKPLHIHVEDIICHFKTPKWQRIVIIRRRRDLSSNTYNYMPMECDENDPHIAALYEHVIKKVDLWSTTPN